MLGRKIRNLSGNPSLTVGRIEESILILNKLGENVISKFGKKPKSFRQISKESVTEPELTWNLKIL